MPDPSLLESLRQVFREELADQLELLAAQRRALEQSSTPEQRAGAAGEMYRAVHSLKGAARSVGYGAIERTCHELEGALAALGPDAGGSELLALAATATERLFASAAELGLAPAGLGEPVAEPSLEPGLVLQKQTGLPPVDRPPSEARDVAPGRLRVAAGDIDGLARAAEGLAATASALFRGGEDSGRLEALLLEVQGDLTQALHAARTLPQALHNASHPAARGGGAGLAADALLRRLERGAASLRTLFAWAEGRRRHEEELRRRAVTHARRVADQARALRVVELTELVPFLEATIREAGSAVGKAVRLEVRADGVAYDRRMQEPLRQALVPLVRNAIDHGLESDDERQLLGKAPEGLLRIAAELRGDELVVSVEDDGRGIDRAALQARARARGQELEGDDVFAVLFEAGFSTRGEATTLSGRGVGLDIVRQRVAELHGRIVVRSRQGEGTAFTLHLPTDLGILRGLVVTAGKSRFVFVLSSVVEVRRVRADAVVPLTGGLHLTSAAGPLPLASLGVLLGFDDPRAAAAEAQREGRMAVVLGNGGRGVALAVEGPVVEEEVVLRPLGGRLRRVPFVAGLTSTSDAEVAWVLHADELQRHARPLPVPAAAETGTRRRRRVLVVDDSVTTRELERSLLRAAGYDVATAPDGLAAWALLSSPDERFDAVVSDIDMPGLDGLQLVARLRASPTLRDLPIVLVTALADEAQKERAVALGASAYIVKGSFDQDELLDVLEQLL